MKKLLLLLLIVGSLFSSDIIKLKSNNSVEETTEKILQELKKQGFFVFDVIDHSKHIRTNTEYDFQEETRTILFDKPQATKAMFTYSSAVMLEVPFRIGIYQTIDEKVYISYKSVDKIIKDYSMQECKFLKMLKENLKAMTIRASK